MDLALELDEMLKVRPGGLGRGAERLGGAQALSGDRRNLFPAAVANEVALTLGERDQLGPGGQGTHEPAISFQAARSSPRSSETSSILAGSCSIDASMR